MWRVNLIGEAEQPGRRCEQNADGEAHSASITGT
jgi:hypothetical protein